MRAGREGGRALKNKPDCKEENLLSIVSSSQSTAHCSSGHPNVFAIKVFFFFFFEKTHTRAHTCTKTM